MCITGRAAIREKNQRSEFSRVFVDIVNNADFAERTVAAHYPALREEAVRFGLYQRLDYLLHIPVGRMVSGDAFYVSVKNTCADMCRIRLGTGI